MGTLDWVEKIKTDFAPSIKAYRESAPGEAEFTVDGKDALPLLRALKNLEGGAFEHLADLTAYDEIPKEPRFKVVYELISMFRKLRCAVIATVETPSEADAEPTIPSSVEIWSGANWLEREVYDMYGIKFSGHPDLRRILLPANFKGYPLRKDFIHDFRQVFPVSTEEEQTIDPFGSNIVRAENE